MAIVFGFKGAMTPSSADEDVAESGILLLLVLVFRVHTCCFLYKTQARGEKKMMKEEICSFFSHREREEAPTRSTFFYARITHTHTQTKQKKTNMSIQEYIETHNLSKRVEETINAAVKAKAPEPISFMVGRVWAF
jgi:hypothetical protein